MSVIIADSQVAGSDPTTRVYEPLRAVIVPWPEWKCVAIREAATGTGEGLGLQF